MFHNSNNIRRVQVKCSDKYACHVSTQSCSVVLCPWYGMDQSLNSNLAIITSDTVSHLTMRCSKFSRLVSVTLDTGTKQNTSTRHGFLLDPLVSYDTWTDGEQTIYDTPGHPDQGDFGTAGDEERSGAQPYFLNGAVRTSRDNESKIQ